MNGQIQNGHNTTTYQLFADWMMPLAGRKSRSKSISLLQQYQSIVPNHQSFKGINFASQLIASTDVKSESEFHNTFIFGVTLEIWRKGKIKQAQMFIDPVIPSLLWISSKTKAFLFDLTFTTVNKFDYDLQKNLKVKDYIVLHYFQQELPIVFRGEKSGLTGKYYNLFNNFINYNKLNNVYPPYFSRIMKLYTITEVKENISRKNSAADILKVSQLIGLHQKQQNLKVLKSIHEKTGGKGSSKDKLELNNTQIGQYFKILHCCEGMKQVFEKYAFAKLENYHEYLLPVMKKQHFKNFIIFEQKQSQKVANQIISLTNDCISFYDFSSYLLNEKQNYAAGAEDLNENLPLIDYFCYSSHNTYLSGNQLTSDSKIERYIQDLQGGLKCVEIDVHNDGARPIITHAINDKSLCQPIDFEETILEINKFCERYPNHYPIIISIENHANSENRYKMLNILLKLFNKKLLIVNEESNITTCKTLSQLKGKIIIKTDSKIEQITQLRVSQKRQIVNQSNYFTLSATKPTPNPSYTQFRQRYDKFSTFIDQFQARKQQFIIRVPKALYLPLAQMTKVAGIFKSQTGVSKQQSSGYQCTSLTNEKAIKTGQQKLIKYTKRSWLRIYPLGTQIASSNYNPVPFLQMGAQIIALNTQTKDHYSFLMMSYFMAGKHLPPDKLGYIEKPIHLRSNQLRQCFQKIYQIRVISSYEKVSIKFYGSENDMKQNLNSSFTFNVQDYQSAFLMFKINQKFKDCIPLRFIRKGYRVLMAKNEMYRDTGLRVLIQIIIKQVQIY